VPAISRSDRSRAGLTLIELMISVAIIGVLASIAIPAFQLYQQRSKRSEAYANLESIRKVQLAYRTEFGAYVTAAPSPGIALGPDKQNWAAEGDKRFPVDPPGGGFDQLGWKPDGATYFDYDTYAEPGQNGPMFTAAAYGDVDSDGFFSVLMYVEPDSQGNTLPCYLCDGGVVPVVSWGSPPIDDFGGDVLKSVARLQAPFGDDF
jgi:prepilin-type N-terminal cleavage/methylation domain-containing protein